MYPVSAGYADWILNNTGARQFSIRSTLSTPAGDISLTAADFVLGSTRMSESSISGDMIEVGSVFSADLTTTIFNNKAIYSEMSMRGSRIFIEIGYVLEDLSVEWIPLGRYIVIESSKPTAVITLKCLDYMILFETPFSDVTLTFPATLAEIITAVCAHVGVSYSVYKTWFEVEYWSEFGTMTWAEFILTFPNDSYNVLVGPSDTTLTCRDVIAHIAGLAGKNARMSRTGSLELYWYGNTRQMTDGYVADANVADTVLDGGTPAITNLLTFDGGYEEQPPVLYTLAPKDRVTFEPDSGQIVLSGLIYEDDTQAYVIGSDNYAVRIGKNPLLQTDIEATLLVTWGEIGWLAYTPYTASVFCDPSRQAGDLIAMTDADGKLYNTIITNINYQLRGLQNLRAIGRSLEIVDYRTTTDKRIVQVDQSALKQGTEYNAVSVDRTNGFVSSATVGGKVVRVQMSGQVPYEMSIDARKQVYVSSAGVLVPSIYDINEDGYVDEEDLELLLDYVLGVPGAVLLPKMDINGDGNVNGLDVALWHRGASTNAIKIDTIQHQLDLDYRAVELTCRPTYKGTPVSIFVNNHNGYSYARYWDVDDEIAVGTHVVFTNCAIPANSIIVGGTIHVTEAVTSGGLATVALGLSGTGGSTTSIMNATAKASLTAGTIINSKTTYAAPVKVTTESELTITIGTADLTGGKIEVFLQYFIID